VFNSYQKLSNSLSLYILDMCDTCDPVYNLWIGDESTYTVIDHAPKNRGRPKGSPNKSKLAQPEQPPAEPKKRGRPKKSTLEQPEQPPAEPKKRGRPKGSPNKSKLAQPEQPPAEPKKRSADKHTRKSPKSIAAATTIQRYARRYINDYTSLVSQINTS